ncbi:helix-turn-helix domain-containing protein [Nocardia veterana]|uniref:Helix-turn-helix transcriptional regulator n=1 Tax=Nocardia veterana TaxID=132249 RepID=A0A7X6M142_9NOCA|nr:helix-turn-helix transcriptional regulator [Nocardia veterana]NKY88359.1 helix-turn-helix transcriptional regulator [Nocardia veterana]
MGEHVGQRIASERKIAGLGQRQLAARANYSLSMVKAVEQGREVASPGFIAAVAKALGIDPVRLQGTPYLETLEEDGPLRGLPDLRAVLAEGAYVRPLEPAPAAELRAELSAVETALRNDRTRRALELLPTVIRRLHGAVEAARSDADRATAHKMLCAAYIAAEGACCRLGYASLTALVLDRLDSVASGADDPGYAVRSLMKRSRLLMSHGSTEVAMDLVDRGLALVPGASEGEKVLRGYCHLRAAIVAARGRRLELAQDHIAAARELARPMPGESNLYTTDFGPGNVEIHACAVELEAGDPGRAAREGAELYVPTDVAAPRVAHHWQDNARAWLMSGKPDRALAALNKARAAAPQQTRLHPSVRETLYGIAAAQRRQSESLLGFANWLGARL